MDYSMDGRIAFDVAVKASNLFRSMIAEGAGSSPQSLRETLSHMAETTIEQIVEMREATDGRMPNDVCTDFLSFELAMKQC